MGTVKTVFRLVIFLVVLAIAVYAIPGKILCVDARGNYSRIKGFYSERVGSLDGVFVGASNVHAFWQPAIGWHERGIAVYNFSCDSMPMVCARYMIAEARKKQPNALYIINLNIFKNISALGTIEKLHGVIDYMPLSFEKIRFIKDVGIQSGLSTMEQLELLFPFIRFHSRWNSLSPWSYGTKETRYKGSLITKDFASKVVDVAKRFNIYSDARTEPMEDAEQAFIDLLDYLDREHVNVLFVKVPQAIGEGYQGRLNVLEELLKSRGFPCLDLLDESETIGINPYRDFYNTHHTNVRGSLKVSRIMADYLVEHYHFADKRGQAEYADWDRAGETYDALIDTWILPFERENNLWQDLNAPRLKKPVVGENSIQLTWSESEGADGYVIYRKTSEENDGKWQLLATAGADALSYMDEALKANTRYTYCVAPFADKDGQKAYGNYKIEGVSCRSPKELESGSEQDGAGGDGN